jgi:hypothetical protein
MEDCQQHQQHFHPNLQYPTSGRDRQSKFMEPQPNEIKLLLAEASGGADLSRTIGGLVKAVTF